MSQATTTAPAKAGPALSPQFHVAHHFRDADTQFDAGRMGIWLFLVTEILLFGGFFCAFAVFRSWYFDSFVEAHHYLSKEMGTLNTVVLIFSSLTMALAVRAAQMNNKKATVALLAVTLLCASIFMCVKYVEYSHKFHDGLLPGKYFSAEGFQSAHGGIFFGIYFAMTGLHGIHVLIGMGLIAWILFRAMKGEFSSRYYAPVEGVGLYWHLVDLIWIFVFPLIYLVG